MLLDSSQALYKACLDYHESLSRPWRILKDGTDQLNLEIRLSLLERMHSMAEDLGSPGSMRLNYHLLIPYPDSDTQLEILVEGPLQGREDQRHSASNYQSSQAAGLTNAIQTFDNACRQVKLRESSDFQAFLEGVTVSDPFRFQITLATEPIKTRGCQRVHISNLLDLIQTQTSAESHEQFPISERLDLTYNIVECGLLLLGTSWLSNLRSKKIQRFSRRDREPRRRFILETGSFSRDELESEEPQIFNVGIILTEIAIAQPIRGVRRDITEFGSQLKFIMAPLRNSRNLFQNLLNYNSMPANQVVDRVNQQMGWRYSKFVEFCLQQSQGPVRRRWDDDIRSSTWAVRDAAYRTLLSEYYENVFLP